MGWRRRRRRRAFDVALYLFDQRSEVGFWEAEQRRPPSNSTRIPINNIYFQSGMGVLGM
jgi:hypothetical protein